MRQISRFNRPSLKLTGECRRGRPVYELTEPFVWWVNFKYSGVCVHGPVGYKTDLISVPAILRPFGLRPDGPGWPAAVVHDLFYSDAPLLSVDPRTGEVHRANKLTRIAADTIFRDALSAFGVGPLMGEAMYLAVRAFGARGWRRDRSALARQVPERVGLELGQA